eukprot:TRINITY_DN4863_c0_g1_i1.p1 TRINITY_DN4863_c0_g1~~TRINITY_DN4863_c0_g1_i1.p1  ORF type:complete len:319 (-),score=49.57 TRINITY_DN4863_c0_g1_i1:103-1059(-)
MKNFFITLALIALTQVRHGDAWANCTLENRQNCLSCMDLGANCGWCAATQQCINGTKAGPSDGSLCLGGAWQYGGAGSCVQCSSLGSCNQCTQHNADCIWCLNRQNVSSCKPIGFSGCVAASSQCACHKYGTCSECIGSSQCQWCPTSGECLELTNSSCPGGAQELTCPCTEYANCFECRTDDSCAWCSDIGGCANKTNLGGCLVAHNCNEYCQQGTDCLGCEQLNGCSWCQNYNDTQCIDTTTQIVTDCIVSAPAHTRAHLHVRHAQRLHTRTNYSSHLPSSRLKTVTDCTHMHTRAHPRTVSAQSLSRSGRCAQQE